MDAKIGWLLINGTMNLSANNLETFFFQHIKFNLMTPKLILKIINLNLILKKQSLRRNI
jgi:hypothetical protein